MRFEIRLAFAGKKQGVYFARLPQYSLETVQRNKSIQREVLAGIQTETTDFFIRNYRADYESIPLHNLRYIAIAKNGFAVDLGGFAEREQNLITFIGAQLFRQ